MAMADAELAVEIADSPMRIREAHQIRHRVYCLERGYEPGEDGLEIDEFDEHAKHVVLRRRASGDVIGTARLVMPRRGGLEDRYPMLNVCGSAAFTGLPQGATSEVSRFALSKDRQGLSVAASSLSRLMLVRGLVMLSRREDITHWCAMMEPTLLRLLRASSIHFQAVGPAVEFHGLRVPSVCRVETMLDRMSAEQPSIYSFIVPANVTSASLARSLVLIN